MNAHAVANMLSSPPAVSSTQSGYGLTSSGEDGPHLGYRDSYSPSSTLNRRQSLSQDSASSSTVGAAGTSPAPSSEHRQSQQYRPAGGSNETIPLGEADGEAYSQTQLQPVISQRSGIPHPTRSPPPPPPPPQPSVQFPWAQDTASASVHPRVPGVRGEWQRDEDVDECPICGTGFTFFYRRHHCRWCGIVVCSPCSSYRLTLPQSIVLRPESERSPYRPDGSNSPHDPENALEAFEDVRVCSVCIAATPGSPTSSSVTRRRATAPSCSRPPLDRDLFFRLWPNSGSTNTNNANAASSSQSSTHNHTRSADYRPVRSNVSSPSFASPQQQHQAPRPSFFCLSYGSRQSPSSHQPRLAAEGTSSPNVATRSYPPPPLIPQRSSVSNASVHSTLPYAPSRPRRRQIPEEDLCPVCARELPPWSGDDDGAAAREAHIQRCIDICLGSASGPCVPAQDEFTAPGLQTTSVAPARPSANTGGEGGEILTSPEDTHQRSTHTQASVSAPSASRPHRHRPGYLIVSNYTATPKDCVRSDGVPFECDICMDDFEEGQNVTLLNCSCRFHHHCLAGWFERCVELAKPGGPREGQRPGCPTHAHVHV